MAFEVTVSSVAKELRHLRMRQQDLERTIVDAKEELAKGCISWMKCLGDEEGAAAGRREMSWRIKESREELRIVVRSIRKDKELLKHLQREQTKKLQATA